MKKESANSFDEMVQGEFDFPQEKADLSISNFSNHVNFDSEDIVIPRIRLAQGLTAEVQDGTAKPGQWLLTGYNPVDELTVVPLMFARNRTLRGEDGNVECKSADAITGVGFPGGICAQCQLAKWGDNGGGGRMPPTCVFSYVYVCYIIEFETLGLIEFRRTSIQAGKTLNTLSAQRGLGNFAVKLKSNKMTGKRGVFYQILVQPVQVDENILTSAKTFIN